MLGNKLARIGGTHTLNIVSRDEDNILDKIHEKKNYGRIFIMKIINRKK